jgi:hypothetical protein
MDERGNSRGLKKHCGLRPQTFAHIALLALLAGCNATISDDQGQSGAGQTGGSGNASGNGSGATGATMPADGPRPVSLDGKPIYTRFLRLTNDQWENSVKDILKLAQPLGDSANFLRPVPGVTDFDNNERVVLLTSTAWSDFQLAAEGAAAAVTTSDQALQSVVSTTDSKAFITTFGRRAFRRELTSDEVSKYQALWAEGASYSGSQSAFAKGAALVISALLQSPYFLYRSEMGDTGKPLSGYEMAAKLSLWLRDTTPTDAMLDAAKSGVFDTAEGAATQAEQMLSDTRTTGVMRKFHGQLYKVDVLESITKTGVTGYSDDLIPEFKEASYLFFDRIFTENLGVKDILTTTVGFAGPKLATLYGVTPSGSGVQRVDLTNRPGWYSQVPFLALWAINNDPDSIHRGVRINLDTLCADPGQPAPDLPPVPALQPNQTNRERYKNLTEGCAKTCHGQIINPIGFAFEGFDGLGRFRDMDNGHPVDTTGTYPFAEGDKSFSGPAELMQQIAEGSQAHECYAKKLASYALERDVVDAERPLVVSLGAASRASGGSVKDVILALVKNDAFRTHVGGSP